MELLIAGVVDAEEFVDDDVVDEPLALFVDADDVVDDDNGCNCGVCAVVGISTRCTISSAISNCGENVRKTPS